MGRSLSCVSVISNVLLRINYTPVNGDNSLTVRNILTHRDEKPGALSLASVTVRSCSSLDSRAGDFLAPSASALLSSCILRSRFIAH
jgi:hypothetical protein